MNIGFRIVDLTAPLYPSKEVRKFTIKKLNAPVDDTIIHEISLSSHIGTHLEVPSHHIPGGWDCAQTPLETLIGEAVIINIDLGKPLEPVSISDIEKTGIQILKNDAVILRFVKVDPIIEVKHLQPDGVYEPGILRPYIPSELANWFVEKGVRLLGVQNVTPDKPIYDKEKGICRYENTNHQIFLGNNIPILERIANLDSLKRTRFLLFVMTYPIGDGVDSFPSRTIALEPSITT